MIKLAALQAFHIMAGRMVIGGMDGEGAVLEAGADLAGGRVTVAVLRSEEYPTNSGQDIKAAWSGYALFNVVQSDRWKLGVGAAYVDFQATDHHNFRKAFGVEPLLGTPHRIAPALAVSRRFGSLLVGFRHFRFETTGGWFNTGAVNMLSVGVGF